jgi:predicted AAA+ superfamily ATPase
MINRILKPPKQPFFLFGPRGTGKSTWVKNCFPNAVHVDLLNDGVYQEYSASPNRLLALVRGYPPQTPIVIDEVQKIPALLSLVHLLIEEDKSRQFILTGSSARKLKRAGVDLLGGRALLYHFHPFIARELGDDFSLENALKTGLVPLVWSAVEPSQTLKGYVGLYLREEVKMEGLVRNVEQFSQFLEVMAFSHGGLLNLNHVSREAQAKRATVDTYVSILEDLLLAFLVPPFTRRAKRAVTSHPKFYYFDAGVFQSLRRRGPFDRPEEIEGQALEGLVAQHLRAWNSYGDDSHPISYWRTSTGAEVDFVVYGSNGLWAIEVKNSDRIRPEDFKGLAAFRNDYPEAKTILLYRGQNRSRHGQTLCLPCDDFLGALTPNQNPDHAFPY